MSQEKKIHVVILCGGSGTRLWPMSITEKPKQFLQIFNGESLFQQTIRRNLNLADRFTVVVNQKQLPTCKEQVTAFPEKEFNFIVESIGRNTAPAICLAALTLQENELFLVTPSDHYVEKIDLYEQNIYEAIELNQNKNHVVFGITPQYAETGYGYIHANNHDVLGFKEKPNKETAEEYLKDQNYFWNSGMFLFHKNFFLQEMTNYSEQILKACNNTIAKINKEKNQIDLPEDLMKTIPSDSIDYALMEKSQNIKISKCRFFWSDLGSYESLYKIFNPDYDLSDSYSNVPLKSIDSNNNLVLSDKKLNVNLIGINNSVIVYYHDNLIVLPQSASQDVKKLL